MTDNIVGFPTEETEVSYPSWKYMAFDVLEFLEYLLNNEVDPDDDSTIDFLQETKSAIYDAIVENVYDEV